MTAIKATVMVRHSNEVVVDGLRLILKLANVGSHVELLERELYESVVFLLSCDLRVHVAEHSTATIARTSPLLEAFELEDENLGDRVELHLLGDVAMLFADIAIPLIVTTQRLFGRVALEATTDVECLLGAGLNGHVFVALTTAIFAAKLVVVNEVTFAYNDNGEDEASLIGHRVHDLADCRV